MFNDTVISVGLQF